jgi:hypothetical protein
VSERIHTLASRVAHLLPNLVGTEDLLPIAGRCNPTPVRAEVVESRGLTQEIPRPGFEDN